MASFQSIHYERVFSTEDEEEELSELPPTLVTTRGAEKNGKWNHIENLDDFFIRIYRYHREQGFVCLLLSDVFALIQYVFIVLFTTFLAVCVDYKLLFHDPNPVFSKVVDWSKFRFIPPGLVVCLIVAFAFWTVRLVKVIHNGFKAWEIRHFFHQVLQIADNDLQNLQWGDVQQKIVDVQEVYQMCIHKKDLTELDIHHRILRQRNYMIALQNKGVVTCVYKFPFVGHRTFLTEGLKYNLNLILFKGPGAPFEKSWKIKSEYKDYSCRTLLASSMARHIFLLGIANLILCPFILIYQILHSFFKYAEMIKRSPDVFGARRWSPYGRLYLRHFNELDHEFRSRLSKSYDPATKYMNSFISPILTLFARNIAFFLGAVLAVMLGLSFYDQDVLTAEHVISFMATLGILIKICAGFIPDENAVFNPEALMKQILSQTHYIPDAWKGRAHTKEVRDEFSRLFQYKFVYLLEELLSPLLTPFILCFYLPHKAQQVVDFYRNFSVEVTGVGDVCSFAQMDVRKHGGNNQWTDGNDSKDDRLLSTERQAENGKTELSLLHFSFKNPTWKPSDSGKKFIETIKEHAIQESLSMSQSFAYQRQISNNGFPNPAYLGSNNDFTTFIGIQNSLQSLAQPNEMSLMQQEALLNTSMLYYRESNDRSQSYPPMTTNIPSNDAAEDGEEHMHQTWPGLSQPVPQPTETSLDTRWNEESKL